MIILYRKYWQHNFFVKIFKFALTRKELVSKGFFFFDNYSNDICNIIFYNKISVSLNIH